MRVKKQEGMEKIEGKKKKNINCWNIFQCKKKECPAYKSKDLKCWLFSGTYCRNGIQGKFLEKMQMCLGCEVFKANTDIASMKAALKVVHKQFKKFNEIIRERDRELEGMSLELALSLSEVFEALKRVSLGDHTVRLDEKSKIELISKLKQVVNLTAKEIGESNETMRFMQFAINHTADAAFWMKSDARFIYVNEAACRLLGYSKNELLSMTVHDIDPLFPKEVWADHWKDLKKRKSFTFESCHKAKDGRIFPVELMINFVEFEGNEYNCAFARDITKRKQEQKKIQESEEKYRAVFESTGTATVIIEEDTTISMANKEAEKLTGYSREEIEGRSWMEIIAEEELDRLREYHRLRRIDPDIAPRNYETRLIDKKGNVKQVFVTAALIPGTNKSIASILDITERKRIEEKLRVTELRYRTVADFTHDWEYWETPDGMLRYVSPSCERITGFKPEHFIHNPNLIYEIIAPEDKDKWVNHGHDAFKVMGRQSIIFRIKRKDNEIRWIEHVCQPVTDKKDIFLGVRASNRDITKRKQAEEELKKSHDNLRSLSSFITDLEEAEKRRLARELHDLVGQNVTALSINLDFLVERLSNESKKSIGSRLQDSKVLVKEIMKFARNIMADLRPLILDDYGLTAAIHWYSGQFFKRTEIPVVFKGEELKPRLLPDVETALFRITQESLTNIAKHANATKVTITLKEIEGKVKLTITDDGIGFDPISINKAGERKGLGLLGMRERTEALGGILHVQSSPSKGTQVIVEVER